MTIETEDYATKILMESGKKIRHDNGWRPFHTDFINNDELQGYHVTYVNGIDDPHNSSEAISDRLEQQRIRTLREKLEDDSISFSQLKDLLRTRL